MNYFLAALPILVVLGLMIFLRWSGQRAGAVGWAAGLLTGLLFFGLNWPVLWVSQLKGLFLALFVLAILWPALLLYNIVDLSGGIRAIAGALEEWVGERGLLLILLAWAFSGLLEGLAGFGLPIAIAAPMLVGLGVPAVQAVAAAAVGHAWSVTFGDMSVVFQTLSAITGRSQAELAPLAALFLGAACIGCGLGAATILKQKHHFPVVIGVGLLMGAVQYGLAVTPLVPLAVILAGLAGMAGILVYARLVHGRLAHKEVPDRKQNSAMLAGLGSYGLLTCLLGVLFMTPGIYDALKLLTWQMHFPEVITRTGALIPAAAGTAIAGASGSVHPAGGCAQRRAAGFHKNHYAPSNPHCHAQNLEISRTGQRRNCVYGRAVIPDGSPRDDLFAGAGFKQQSGLVFPIDITARRRAGRICNRQQ
jgi:lactate permease